MTRSFCALALAALPLVAGCSRLHLYKTAGGASRAAFAAQRGPHAGPQPRGFDGDEATTVIGNQKRRMAPGENDGSGHTPTGQPRSTLLLQAR